MALNRVLVIEKAGGKEPLYGAALEARGFHVDVVGTGRAAQQSVFQQAPAVVVINAPSLGTNGVRICQKLRDEFRELPLIHVVSRDTASHSGRGGPANVTLSLPFTPRKLANRVMRFMPPPQDEVVSVGPVQLWPSTRMVRCDGREQRLTPRAAALLELFLRHPGKTLERGLLMQQVWHTDYMGDTRTIDVHIRWIREAIESNPRMPRYLVTVRGVGYRFAGDAAHHPESAPKGQAVPIGR